MNISKIKPGMVIKNYKELCELLEEKVKNGAAKVYQLKIFESLVKFYKVKHSIHIEKIYEKPLKIVNKREFSSKTAPYIEDLELLLLDLLSQFSHSITISKNGMYTLLKMVNTSYSFYSGIYKPLLSKQLGSKLSTIEKFYEVSSSVLNQSITTVLSRLERRRLIFHQKVKMVMKISSEDVTKGNIPHISSCHVDEDGIEHITYKPSLKAFETDLKSIVATEEEIKSILRIEKEVLKNMNLNEDSKVSYLFHIGKYKTFKKEVNKKLVEKHNIAFYYDALKVIYNQDHVIEARDYMIKNLIEKQEKQQIVNGGLIEHIKKRGQTTIPILDYIKYIDSFVEEVIKIDNVK